MVTGTELEILSRLAARMAVAKNGDTGALVTEIATLLGCSDGTVYRKLHKAGLLPERDRRRSDSGSSVVTQAMRELVGGVSLASQNKKGQRMPMNTVLSMARASGQLPVDVHPSTMLRQLRDHRVHPDHLALPSASVRLASEFPGHMSQVDSTTGAYYYLPGGFLRWMPEDEFYKNKTANIVKASSDLLTRYAYVDHTSHAFKCRYYLGGETAENLIDFVSWAMWKQEASPMEGVPRILYMDPGAANKGKLIRNYCKRLDIELRNHKAGNARATGSVEKVHDIVRMHFESRLRFQDPKTVSLDQLNTSIERWTASYCWTSIHTRHKRTRYGAWLEIKPEQLVRAASLEALRDAATREPVTRLVENDRTISFESRIYELDQVPGVIAGLKVTVAQNPFRAPAIDVLHLDRDSGEETWHLVEPRETTEWGFPVSAAKVGLEMRTARNSEVDEMRNKLGKDAYGLPTLDEVAKARKMHAQAYAGVIDSMADVDATPVPAHLPRRGTPLSTPTREVAPVMLSVVAVCMRLKTVMGDAYDGAATYAWVSANYPNGAAEFQIEGIRAQLNGGSALDARTGTDSAAPGGLHIVGGSA